VSLALGLVGIWFQNHRAITRIAIEMGGLAERLANAGNAFWFYVWKGLAPFQLSMIYPPWPASNTEFAFVPLFLAVAALLMAWLFRAGWGRPVLASLGAFALMLFPVLGFFRMFYFHYSPVADHWAYIALPALMALVAAQPVQRHLVCGALALLFGFLSFQRAGLFQNQTRIWNDTLATNPQAWVAHMRLGHAMAHCKQFQEAIRHYKGVLEIKPDNAEAHYNIGMAAIRADDCSMAIRHLEEAARLQWDKQNTLTALGIALAEAGRAKEGIARLREAAALDPPSAYVLNNLGWILLVHGETKEAISHLERATRLQPGYTKARMNFAEALERAGRTEEAARQRAAAMKRLKAHPAGD
jgi:Flp pilus assembly protein TadD